MELQSPIEPNTGLPVCTCFATLRGSSPLASGPSVPLNLIPHESIAITVRCAKTPSNTAKSVRTSYGQPHRGTNEIALRSGAFGIRSSDVPLLMSHYLSIVEQHSQVNSQPASSSAPVRIRIGPPITEGEVVVVVVVVPPGLQV